MCVHEHKPMHGHTETKGGWMGSCSLTFYSTPLRQGLSLSLELSWHPANLTLLSLLPIRFGLQFQGWPNQFLCACFICFHEHYGTKLGFHAYLSRAQTHWSTFSGPFLFLSSRKKISKLSYLIWKYRLVEWAICCRNKAKHTKKERNKANLFVS